jgi:hypothetical protein
MHTKNVLAGLILASSGLFAVSASAALITAWDFATDGGFVIGGSTCNNGGEAACDMAYNNGAPAVTPSGIAGTASIMTWGTGVVRTGSTGEQSGLQGVFGTTGEGPYNAQALGGVLPVTIPAFEQILTNGDWVNTGAAVHYNNIIDSTEGYMRTSTLETTFQLTAPVVGPVLGTNISILFTETNNTAPCPGLNPHGTICDDIFTVTDQLDPIVFTIEGITYTVQFRRIGGPGSIVVNNTIWTAENAPGTSVMYIQARIFSRELRSVPVPGVLGLMGVGLLILGWRTRARTDT